MTFNQLVKNSLLFNKKSINSQYSKYSETKLQQELEKYRQDCLRIANQTAVNKQNLNIIVEGTSHLPKGEFYKQTALYVDKVFVDDPVFKFSLPSDHNDDVMNKFIGMKNSGIDRNGLSRAADYVRKHEQAIRLWFY